MPKNIFSRSGKLVLNAFLDSKVLLAFDYDGTLAPIVNDPKSAFLRSRTASLLKRVAKHYPLVVISGRKRADVRRLIKDIPVCETIGNHGIEPWQSNLKIRKQVQLFKKRIVAELPNIQGVMIEDKIYSLSIHYRRSRKKKEARRVILKVASTIPGVRILSGKQVINVIPEDGPHKGITLHKAMKTFGCTTSVYLGDDVTDEDVFNMDAPGEILGIRVGSKKETAASYFIPKQTLIDKFLQLIVDMTILESKS